MGAWIETISLYAQNVLFTVAPRVGAWIETTSLYAQNVLFTSHPVWVRGLKPALVALAKDKEVVAPRVGAWIETCFSCFS